MNIWGTFACIDGVLRLFKAGMFKIDKADSETTIFATILKNATLWGLSMNNCRGATGDGAAVVAAAVQLLVTVPGRAPINYIRCVAHFINLSIVWALHYSLIHAKGGLVVRETGTGNSQIIVCLEKSEAKIAKINKKNGISEPDLKFYLKDAVNKGGIITRVRKIVNCIKKSNVINNEFRRLQIIQAKHEFEVAGSNGHMPTLPSVKNFADTLWGFIHRMLLSVFKNKAIFPLLVTSGVSDKLEKIPVLTEFEFLLMADLVALLEPVSNGIIVMETNSCVVGKVIELLGLLKTSIGKVAPRTAKGMSEFVGMSFLKKASFFDVSVDKSVRVSSQRAILDSQSGVSSS